jgi:chromosome segregation ATPase
MVKKAILAGAGAVLLSALFFGRDAWSYVSTSAGWVKDSVKSSVPVEFEIERARAMIKDLVPDIQKNMHVIAKEEVEVERLQKQIAQMEEKQGADRVGLLRLKSDLASNKGSYEYGGRTFTVSQVKLDMSNRFERFKTNDATLESMRQICQAREKSLSAARQKLDGMLAARRQLDVDVQNLDAKLKMVEAAQTTSDFNFDDSRLARCKDLISDLRTRLDVAAKMVDAQGNFQGEIPLNEAASSDIVEEVTEYFQGGSAKLTSR